MTFKPTACRQMEARNRNRKVLGENVEMKAFRPTDWPVGACFVPILCKVFAPEEKRPPRQYHEPHDPETGEIR